jgi:hypothetical protein
VPCNATLQKAETLLGALTNPTPAMNANEWGKTMACALRGEIADWVRTLNLSCKVPPTRCGTFAVLAEAKSLHVHASHRISWFSRTVGIRWLGWPCNDV